MNFFRGRLFLDFDTLLLRGLACERHHIRLVSPQIPQVIPLPPYSPKTKSRAHFALFSTQTHTAALRHHGIQTVLEAAVLETPNAAPGECHVRLRAGPAVECVPLGVRKEFRESE